SVGTFQSAPVSVPKTATPAASPAALTVTLRAGKAVSLSKLSVPAGSYAITVHDESTTADVHLVGKGVDRKTRGKQTVVWNVQLLRGSYRFGATVLKVT